METKYPSGKDPKTFPYIPNDSRIIRIETNPNKTVPNKYKMKVPEVDATGTPIVNEKKEQVYGEIDVQNIVRIPTTKKTISPSRLSNGRVNTGMDHYVKNPYKDARFVNEKWERILKGSEEAKLHHLLEYEHGEEPDFYTADVTRDVVSSRDGSVKKFFASSSQYITLTNNTVILRMDNRLDRVRYYTILAHKAIANSYKDLLEGDYNTNYDWYIVDDEERETVKQSRVQKDIFIGSSVTKLFETKNHEAIIKMAKALNLNEANDKSLNGSKAQRIVYEYANSGDANYETYKIYFEMWDNKSNKGQFEAYAELFDFMRYQLVTYRSGKYVLPVRTKEGDILETKQFNSKDELVNNFILDIVNREQVEYLRNQLKEMLK